MASMTDRPVAVTNLNDDDVQKLDRLLDSYLRLQEELRAQRQAQVGIERPGLEGVGPGEIGAIAKPDQIRFTDSLPKTRSGKIMRRLLRDIAAGNETTQDTTTLEDFNVLAKLRETDD